VSSFIFEGPGKCYDIVGWSSFQAKAWVNSAALYVTGYKKITFMDGTQITYNGQGDQFGNIFMGTMYHQLTGKIEFNDPKNGLYGWYEMGNVKKKNQDYFSGQIEMKGQKVCDIYGNYMGFMDFSGIRYYDGRQVNNMVKEITPTDNLLPSDALNRIDS
jgi:hypothetical protein